MDRQIAIVGAGVVGCALALELSSRGVEVLLLEAESRIGLGASAANSGILHTGFDSSPGELETRMILRSAQLREQILRELPDLPLRRCGARLRAREEMQLAAVRALRANAESNGVEVSEPRPGELLVPGEAVTDPLVFTRALAVAASAAGAELAFGARVREIAAQGDDAVRVALADGSARVLGAVVNCAGLQGDEVAAMAGEAGFEVYPRKGEFLVFEQPPGRPLEEILLPVPSAAGKGVLVFPTVDGHVIAGPTARERLDKRDWSVEPDAGELILARAREMFEPLRELEPIAAYAGLRPAGRGCNYVLSRGARRVRMLNVAAIRSTGLSAALGLAEHVAGLLAEAGWVTLGKRRAMRAPGAPEAQPPWWQLAARRSGGGG